MTLAHTIIAMVGGQPVKVECNTCHSVHRYRGGSSRPASSSPSSPRAPREKEKKTVISFDEVLRTKNLAMAMPYSPRSTYQLDQVIEHKIFGLGFVSAVRDAGKIEVTFRTDVKILIHGKG